MGCGRREGLTLDDAKRNIESLLVESRGGVPIGELIGGGGKVRPPTRGRGRARASTRTHNRPARFVSATFPADIGAVCGHWGGAKVEGGRQ